MTGAVRTLEREEERARQDEGTGLFAPSNVKMMGRWKHAYGKKHEYDTTDVGYTQAKENKAARDAMDERQKQMDAEAAAKLEGDMKVQAAREESQMASLKRRGRRASILTSGRGVEDQLGAAGGASRLFGG